MTLIDYLLNMLMLLTVLMLAETIFIIYLIIKNEFKSAKISMKIWAEDGCILENQHIVRGRQ
jgi:hypothetical protein